MFELTEKKKVLEKKAIKPKATLTKPAAPKAKPKTKLPAPALKVLSSPAYADILLDGKVLGSTPMKEYQEVTVGTHTIKLTHRRHGKLDSTVILKPGDSLTIKLKYVVE